MSTNKSDRGGVARRLARPASDFKPDVKVLPLEVVNILLRNKTVQKGWEITFGVEEL